MVNGGRTFKTNFCNLGLVKQARQSIGYNVYMHLSQCLHPSSRKVREILQIVSTFISYLCSLLNIRDASYSVTYNSELKHFFVAGQKITPF